MTSEELKELIKKRDKLNKEYDYWRKRGNLDEDEYKQYKLALMALDEIEMRLEGYTEGEHYGT